MSEIAEFAIKLLELAAKTQSTASGALWTPIQVATDQIEALHQAIKVIDVIRASQIEGQMSSGTDGTLI